MELKERKLREALRALTSLEGGGFQARMAGGCVRDRLMGVVPFDFDVATSAKPPEVIRHFEATGLRTVPTGLDHGTVTLLMPAGPVEITTLRIDVATDGRHAQVEYGDSFELDAARRDFTINAMSEDARGVVYDYFSGQQDLKGRVLRFVGDAPDRIAEDYLRIMRFFRFTARFGFEPAPGTLEAIKCGKDGLKQISQERITSELIKTFASPHAARALRLMADASVLELVLPEVSNAAKEALPTFPGMAPEKCGLAVFAALLLKAGVSSPKAVKELGERLKMANVDAKLLAFAAEAPARLKTLGSAPADSLAFIDAAEVAAGPGAFAMLYLPLLAPLPDLASALARVERDEARHGHRRQAALPLDGHAVKKALGIKDGPELGKVLEELKRAYRNGDWTTKDEGVDWLSARKV